MADRGTEIAAIGGLLLVGGKLFEIETRPPVGGASQLAVDCGIGLLVYGIALAVVSRSKP